MLFVNRDSVVEPPLLLFGDRFVKAKHDAREHFSQSPTQRRQERFRFDTQIPNSPELQNALLHLFHSKCAYCESSIGLSEDGLVDRFRPRSFTTDLEGEVLDDLYWWLAYEWENLYISCAKCNRNKGKRFPVAGKRATPDTYREALRHEDPLLLDPCYDDPNEHLVFERNGSVRGSSDRGQITIDVLGLNRPQLIAARLQQISVLLTLFRGVQRGDAAGWDDIERMLQDPNTPYLGALRQVSGHEFKKLSGLRKRSTNVDRAVTSIIKVAGASIGAGVGQGLVDVVASSLASVLSNNLLSSEAKTSSQAGYSLEAREDVDHAYFRTTRMVEAVEIRDFRKIHKVRLDFGASTTRGAPWGMLLGENGVGKSSILQGIALTLIGREYLKALELNPENYIRKGARRAEVKVWLTNQKEPAVLHIDPVTGFSGTQESKVLILAYGATRLMPRPDMHKERTADYAKVDNLFNPFVPVGDAEDWLLGLTKPKFDIVARALKDLLIDLDGPDQIVRRSGRVMVETTLGMLPLEQLSDGYQSVIGVTADIMRIMLRYWKTMEVAEGIVLIDELGAHLHPRWRMRVVSGLRRAFPRVQFIASTHDPLCLRGLQEGEVIVLRENENSRTEIITDVPPVNKMRVEQLLTSELFGLHSTVDPDLDARFEEYLTLKANNQGDPEILEELASLKEVLTEGMMLGRDRRERMMLEAIDESLAAERGLSQEKRGLKRAETKGKLKKIWAQELPLPLDGEGK